MKKVSNLTGYVPSYFEKYPPDMSKERTIDVGYRGRNIGFWLGALGQEKIDIGKCFLQYTEGQGLCCDISWREEDRIYGKAWLRFQRNCRCVLGTESGASVIDFSGQIETQVREYLRDRPDATFQEVQDLFFKE